MLTGQNGILNRASEAKEKTELAGKDEKRKLAQAEALMNTEKTTYKGITIPEGFAPTKIEGEDSVEEGLVITDGNGNEYVWVEVPKTTAVYKTAGLKITNFVDGEYTKIEKDLKEYTKSYKDSSYSDTDSSFITLYKDMLKSVYTNGGFWIGRYEAGIDGDTPRANHISLAENDRAVIKQNKIPWIYITRDEAYELATRMKYEECTSSLIFGLQWDLVLKYIETKETNANLITGSKALGNYYDNLWNITNANAKYSIDYGDSFIACPYQKKENTRILLTTGADKSFSIMNIYDIAGNVWEWTLEVNDSNKPYTGRGGCYYNNGSGNSANARDYNNTKNATSYTGFRVGLW